MAAPTTTIPLLEAIPSLASSEVGSGSSRSRRVALRAAGVSPASAVASTGPVAASVRPAKTRARICSIAWSDSTRSTASGLPPLAVSTRTSATSKARCTGFWTRSMFWMREYGMCRSVRVKIPSRMTISSSARV